MRPRVFLSYRALLIIFGEVAPSVTNLKEEAASRVAGYSDGALSNKWNKWDCGRYERVSPTTSPLENSRAALQCVMAMDK